MMNNRKDFVTILRCTDLYLEKPVLENVVGLKKITSSKAMGLQLTENLCNSWNLQFFAILCKFFAILGISGT